MRKNVSNLIHFHLKERFEEMLLAGAFPEVKFNVGGDGFKSYSMIDYSVCHARFAYVVSQKLDEMGEDGIFTNKRSAAFVEILKAILAHITEEEVRASPRFKTMWD